MLRHTGSQEHRGGARSTSTPGWARGCPFMPTAASLPACTAAAPRPSTHPQPTMCACTRHQAPLARHTHTQAHRHAHALQRHIQLLLHVFQVEAADAQHILHRRLQAGARVSVRVRRPESRLLHLTGPRHLSSQVRPGAHALCASGASMQPQSSCTLCRHSHTTHTLPRLHGSSQVKARHIKLQQKGPSLPYPNPVHSQSTGLLQSNMTPDILALLVRYKPASQPASR